MNYLHLARAIQAVKTRITTSIRIIVCVYSPYNSSTSLNTASQNIAVILCVCVRVRVCVVEDSAVHQPCRHHVHDHYMYVN